MNPPNTPPPDPPGTCRSCGGTLAGPLSGRGVCLSCAGARVLEFDVVLPTEPIPFPGGWETGGDGLPEQIGDCHIIEELGRGGMGRVFAGRQLGLGRIVAIKAIPVGAAAATDLERRFLREAQTVARLRHPNIVAVHGFGRANGFAYFTMEYIEGGDLGRRVRGRSLGPREAATLLQKVAKALAYTHSEGVLHRDLKPTNILLDGDDPKVADFGLAAQLEPGGDLTAVSGVIGTPHYLAPEAMRGGSAALGVASDVYAVGVILFELCTGRTPFAGASPVELMDAAAGSEPPSPRLLAPAMPADLETICLKCLERDPRRRYASMGALAEDLGFFLRGEAIRAKPISGLGRFLRWCRRRPALAAVWLLVTALAIGSTLAATWIERERGRSEQALAGARSAEAQGRERLREARLAQARALRRTTVPGRRAEALSALAEAAAVRPGPDLRDEVLAALLIPDIRPLEQWDLATGVPSEINFDPAATFATFEPLDSSGQQRGPGVARHWKQAQDFATIAAKGTVPLGRLRFSRDGTLVMARYRDSTLRVWRIGEEKPYIVLADREPPAPDVPTEELNDDYDFAPDASRFVVGLPHGGVSIHLTSDGSQVGTWKSTSVVNAIRFSPDGLRFAAAVFAGPTNSNMLFVVNGSTGELEHAISPGDAPGSISWSSDSRVIAVALHQNLVVTYDVRDGRMLTRYSSIARNPHELVYVGDDTLLAVRGAGTTTMHLLNAARGEDELLVDNIGASFVTAVPGTRSFVISDNAGLVTRWEVVTPTGFRTVPPPRPAGYEQIGDSGALDFSPDGRWEMTSARGYSIIRDTQTGRLAGEIDDHVEDVTDVATGVFSTDASAIIRCSVKQGLRRVQLSWPAPSQCTAGRVDTLDGEKGFVIAACTDDRRRFALIDYRGGGIKVIEVGASGARTLSRWITPGVYTAAFGPGGRQLLVNCSGLGPGSSAQRLQVHDAETGAVAVDLGPDVSCDSAWTADGRFALTSHGQKESILWNTAGWKPVAHLAGELGGDMTTFAFSPDGSYMVIARDQAIYLVSTRDGSKFASITVPSAPGLASAIKFVPGKQEFAVLWRDSRVDYFAPEVLRTELSRYGLAW